MVPNTLKSFLLISIYAYTLLLVIRLNIWHVTTEAWHIVQSHHLVLTPGNAQKLLRNGLEWNY